MSFISFGGFNIERHRKCFYSTLNYFLFLRLSIPGTSIMKSLMILITMMILIILIILIILMILMILTISIILKRLLHSTSRIDSNNLQVKIVDQLICEKVRQHLLQHLYAFLNLAQSW